MSPSESISGQRQVPFELQVMANAVRYQHWLASLVLPFLGNRILEIGSGIGNLSTHIPVRERLILSDIDPSLLAILKEKFPENLDARISVLKINTLKDDVLKSENIDSIVSFNVLEHVKDDSALLKEAVTLLRQSNSAAPKRIVTIVPAHQWAYGNIDRSFGHYRRYNEKSFRAALLAADLPVNRQNFHYRYLNIPALLGWWLNGRILGKSMIGTENMRIFELLCPLIRPIDNFLHASLRIPLGNSLLTVYKA